MEKSLILSIIALVMINVIDAVTNSVVGPSLIFYVTQMGGSKEDYGLVMSAAFFSGLIMMSFYGAWVDGNGNKYKAPYALSFTLGIVGSFIYFLAILLPVGKVAVGAILLGRLVTGMGASGRTLAYSWVATTIDREEQRTVLTIMSMTRSCGMMLGPLLNLFVAKVDTQLVISSKFDLVIPVNQNNSVGLIVALGEGILFVTTFLFLVDPPEKDRGMMAKDEKPKKAGLRDIWEAITHFDLFFCFMCTFFGMFNFTFYSVAIPVVASHAFGWTPVEISNVLAAQAVVVFVGMCVAMIFSMKKAPDIFMIGFGQLSFVVGGTMTYYSWTVDASSLQFVVPIMLISLSFPFIGPANRSKFTKVVHGRPELEYSHGVMQSLYSQAFMVAGLISPNFVTAFILRSPTEIESSGSPYELSTWAWCIPISSMLLIAGLVYDEVILGKNELGLFEKDNEEEVDAGVDDDAPATERSRLMLAGKRTSRRKRRSSVVEINQHFSRQYEVNRRSSVEANGIVNPFETRDEIALSDRLLEDKCEWNELAKLDAAMEDIEST